MPREALYERKVPVMLTAAQCDWLDDYRFTNRFEGRSEAIRALIDRERERASSGSSRYEPLGHPDLPGDAPTIRPYSPDDYPGQGFAPRIVPFLIRTARRSYTDDELVTEVGLTRASAEPGQLASIRNTMKACGFVPAKKRLPGKPVVTGWECP